VISKAPPCAPCINFLRYPKFLPASNLKAFPPKDSFAAPSIPVRLLRLLFVADLQRWSPHTGGDGPSYMHPLSRPNPFFIIFKFRPPKLFGVFRDLFFFLRREFFVVPLIRSSTSYLRKVPSCFYFLDCPRSRTPVLSSPLCTLRFRRYYYSVPRSVTFFSFLFLSHA